MLTGGAMGLIVDRPKELLNPDGYLPFLKGGDQRRRQMCIRDRYSLMSSYSHNVVLIDKHNGQGRHFAVQSAAMGAWLSGVCDNWGSNVESWLWWEEGLGLYDDMGGTCLLYTSLQPHGVGVVR